MSKRRFAIHANLRLNGAKAFHFHLGTVQAATAQEAVCMVDVSIQASLQEEPPERLSTARLMRIADLVKAAHTPDSDQNADEADLGKKNITSVCAQRVQPNDWQD